MTTRWKATPSPSETAIKKLAKELGVTPLISKLLLQRGIETFEQAKTFFRPSLSDLHDPYLMTDMDKAVHRIETAIASNEKIMVYGDYDVDGTTAVSLVYSYLKTIHSNLITYIPDRYNEGYGVSFAGIDKAQEEGCSLIIALDCGIKSIDKVAYAKERSIDFIICDHHRPGDTLPEAVAILDPKREDCNYPYKELCGCGIGFKLIQALAVNRSQSIEELIPYLDLVTTAIGADIVPITGENRILAKFGLDVINSSPRPGIKALLKDSSSQSLTISDIVFMVAPRINAAGRIKHGQYAVQLLTEFNFEEAQKVAQEIEEFNTSRKELDQQITLEALSQITANNEEKRFTTVVYQENWHKGVIGIVASRLTETYYRPTLVFTKSGDFLAASARSVKHFDIYTALEQCSDHIEQFGGHMYAAGLTLREDQFNSFKEAFEKTVSTTIDPDLLIPEISIDAEIQLTDVTPKFLRILKQFEPFGPENMAPVFLTKRLYDTGYGRYLGNQDEHLKLYVKQGNSEGYAGIGFGLGDKFDFISDLKPFDGVYSIEENHWNGHASIQLRFKDIRPSNS